MTDSEWKRVVYAHQCTDLYGDGETLLCPNCGIDYADCPCPGPHQEDSHEYRLVEGVIWAKPRERQLDLFETLEDEGTAWSSST